MNEEKKPGMDSPDAPIKLSGAGAPAPAAPAAADTTRPIVLSQAPPMVYGEPKPVVDKPTTIVAAPPREKK